MAYQYDPMGNLLAISDAAKATRYTRNEQVNPISRYNYDAPYQLCQACGRENVNASHMRTQELAKQLSARLVLAMQVIAGIDPEQC